MKPTVYLAGPISGLTFEQANEWRNKVRRVLLPDIECLNPMRGQDYLANQGILSDGYSDPLCTDKAIFIRDFTDVKNADLVFLNLLDAHRITQGSIYEAAWTWAFQKPLLVVMEPVGNPHDHLFLRQCASFRTDNLIDACDITRRLLLPA